MLIIAALSAFIYNTPIVMIFIPMMVAIADRLNQGPSRLMMPLSFAANCSFATPIGYQTNLLVMGPRHYKFGDYLRGGTPLIVLIWLAFSLLAPSYYGF
mgnify:FL=1